MELTDCCQSFQDEIATLSELSGKTSETVYGEWQKYCGECSMYDQSPVMFEFCEWYGYEEMV